MVMCFTLLAAVWPVPWRRGKLLRPVFKWCCMKCAPCAKPMPCHGRAGRLVRNFFFRRRRNQCGRSAACRIARQRKPDYASADAHQVPAGGALAVDREAFSQAVTAKIEAHPNITIEREEVTDIPADWQHAIVATARLPRPLCRKLSAK